MTRPPLLPPAPGGARLRDRRPDRAPDGELRLPHRRPRDGRGRRGRSRRTASASSSSSSAPRASRSRGVLATHWHADHVGGDIMGYGIEGIRELAGMDDVAAPVHVHRDEAEWVKRTTGVSDSDLVAPRQRRHRDGRATSRSRSCTRRGTRPGASASSSTAGSSPATRCSSRGAAAPTSPAPTPTRCTRASRSGSRRSPTTPSSTPGTCTRPEPFGDDGRDASAATTCSASAASTSGACSWERERARRASSTTIARLAGRRRSRHGAARRPRRATGVPTSRRPRTCASAGCFLVAWVEAAVGCGGSAHDRGRRDQADVHAARGSTARCRPHPVAALEVRAGLGYGASCSRRAPSSPRRSLYESLGYAPIAPYGQYKDFPESRCFAKDL